MTLGPNTNLPPEMLTRRCILCCGEDRATLLAAAAAAGLQFSQPLHAYRCYEFWKRDNLMLICTGIGTGCLEPLMWEILQPAIIDEIILVGTAAASPTSPALLGQPYVIRAAYLAGTGLDGENLPQPLTPRYPGLENHPQATSASTDFFYGFAPRIQTGAYPFHAGRLAAAYRQMIEHKIDLIEMEVAQFYAFCAAFHRTPSRFLAFKGVSNRLGVESEQVPNSHQAITASLQLARNLLER